MSLFIHVRLQTALMSYSYYCIFLILHFIDGIGSVRNSPGKVTCPGGKQVEKVACPP